MPEKGHWGWERNNTNAKLSSKSPSSTVVYRLFMTLNHCFETIVKCFGAEYTLIGPYQDLFWIKRTCIDSSWPLSCLVLGGRKRLFSGSELAKNNCAKSDSIPNAPLQAPSTIWWEAPIEFSLVAMAVYAISVAFSHFQRPTPAPILATKTMCLDAFSNLDGLPICLVSSDWRLAEQLVVFRKKSGFDQARSKRPSYDF